MIRKIFVLFLFLAVFISAETLVLQNGLNGYNGTEDVTIFNDGKAENYSWYQGGQYFGTPDDELLVNTEFCC